MSAKARHYSSHLPVVVEALRRTDGDVLELGTGYFSTPVMHWLCEAKGRKLWSYDLESKYYEAFKQFASKLHTIELVTDWNSAPIERPWDVVLVDHSPDYRRKDDVRRLAPWAKYIIIHDACGRDDRHYHYTEIYPLFKSIYTFDIERPYTKVLSNLVDLADFHAN